MSSITYALIPVFTVIMIGFFLRTSKLIADDEWAGINHLCYYLLLPMLIIKSLSTADLSSAPVFRIAAAMILATIAVSIILFAARIPLSKLLGLDNAGYTSLFQGSTRWHGFIALAIIAALYGDKGVIIGSIGLATLIPLLNLINVTVLSLYGDRNASSAPGLMRQLSQNPFIIACIVGILLNLAPFAMPSTVVTTLDLMGRAALGISLLTVGAALKPRLNLADLRPVFSAAIIRLIGMPFFMVMSCLALGVTGEPLIIAVICAAVPTAASGYILAKQMGGDADLMASIITFQVLAATLTLPLVLSYALNATG